jgi:hypothetical protein
MKAVGKIKYLCSDLRHATGRLLIAAAAAKFRIEYFYDV